MKEKYLSLLFFFISCFYPFAGSYGETDQQSSPQTTTTIEEPSTQVSKPPKNYFDIKTDSQDDRFFSEFVNMLTTLGLIVVLILIATWFLKRMVNSKIQQLNTTSEIKVIERRTLTPKTSLYLLDIQGKGFIIAESLNGVTSLGNFDVTEEEKSQPPVSFKP